MTLSAFENRKSPGSRDGPPHRKKLEKSHPDVDYCVVSLDGLGLLPADWSGTAGLSWALVISSMAGICWVTQSVLGKAMHQDKNPLQTKIHMGCCVLTLNFWRLTTKTPLFFLGVLWVSDCNQSIGIGNLLEWYNHWAASSQAAARALESCVAMLTYRTTHLPPANRPNMSASCSQ